MPRNEADAPEPRVTHQTAVERLQIGQSYSVSRRIDIQTGLSVEALHQHRAQVRGSLDQTAIRARRKMRPNEYTVESVSAVTPCGALILTAVCTRVL